MTTVNERRSGRPDLGPPPKSSVDWFFTRRPGRSLDAAQVELGAARPGRLRSFGAAVLALFRGGS